MFTNDLKTLAFITGFQHQLKNTLIPLKGHKIISKKACKRTNLGHMPERHDPHRTFVY